MLKLKRNSKVNGCEPYKLDLMDYATGEMTFLTKGKQRRLFNHLRGCASCREMFFDYENIYSLLVTTAHVQEPEFIDRMNRLKEQFKRELAPSPYSPGIGRDSAIKGVPVIKPIPGEVLLNHDEHIGQAAVKLWHYLYGNGKIKVNDLEQKVELPAPVLNQALGWLARGKQINRTQVKESIFVYLAPEEIQKHQAQTQV